jgi:hypothetical protein
MPDKRPEIIEHSITCTECREIYREMLNEDREAFIEKYREILQEELQTSGKIKDQVDRLENTVSWLIVVCIAQTLAIIYLFLRILPK